MAGVSGDRESDLVTGIAFKSEASTVIAEVETAYEPSRNLLDYIEIAELPVGRLRLYPGMT